MIGWFWLVFFVRRHCVGGCVPLHRAGGGGNSFICIVPPHPPAAIRHPRRPPPARRTSPAHLPSSMRSQRLWHPVRPPQTSQRRGRKGKEYPMSTTVTFRLQTMLLPPPPQCNQVVLCVAKGSTGYAPPPPPPNGGPMQALGANLMIFFIFGIWGVFDQQNSGCNKPVSNEHPWSVWTFCHVFFASAFMVLIFFWYHPQEVFRLKTHFQQS